ncbi:MULTISPECIES: hypothetical protein [Bacteroides]|uniref:hypothetical protein n=1 Tax=Bacteroides TaxID=816 RepID=UPI00259CCD3D|nr:MULTISPECIES: hypothetical protein [Bacteroides]
MSWAVSCSCPVVSLVRTSVKSLRLPSCIFNHSSGAVRVYSRVSNTSVGLAGRTARSAGVSPPDNRRVCRSGL